VLGCLCGVLWGGLGRWRAMVMFVVPLLLRLRLEGHKAYLGAWKYTLLVDVEVGGKRLSDSRGGA